MSLVARAVEAAGIPTMVIGSALDIMVEVGVPRVLFVDYPLGNPCGRPGDRADQAAIVDLALDLAVSAVAPRTVTQAPSVWPEQRWRENYMRVGDDNRAALAEAGEQRRARQAADRASPR